MQLVAGGFFIFVECVSVDVQRCRDLRVPEETCACPRRLETVATSVPFEISKLAFV